MVCTAVQLLGLDLPCRNQALGGVSRRAGRRPHRGVWQQDVRACGAPGLARHGQGQILRPRTASKL
eukprot:2014822-Alexandrium_andersonii.AAC.1